MEITTFNRRLFALVVALVAFVFCVALVPGANATETAQTRASYSVQQTDSGVQVSLDNASFRKNVDGSVAILASDGSQVDSLPATYQGNGIEYRLVNDSELVATRGERNPFSKYHQSYFNGGQYAGCIAKTALGTGVTGTAAGLLGGLVGGLV